MIQPKYYTHSSTSILLLTPGFNKKQVDSLIQKNPDWFLRHVDQPYKNSKLISHYDLPQHDHEVKVVAGQGLPVHALDRMVNKTFQFVSSPVPEGITSLWIPADNLANRRNIIRGSFNSIHDGAWLYLDGPAGKEDSIQLQKKGQSQFELSFVPKLPGEFIYSLSIHVGAKSYQEILPVHVNEDRILNILFLLNYPSFEMQYLKNFLSSKNHRITLRYQLSANNFRYEYINDESLRVDRITSDLLNDFDILITDESTLSSFSGGERSSLENSIRAGLGLLNLTPITNGRLATFFQFETIPIKVDTTRITLQSKVVSLSAARTRVKDGEATVALQKNKSGLITGYTFRGAGKIGFQLIQESYRLGLSGDSLAYSEIWTPLLEQISRKHHQNSKIKIVTPFPYYENDPLDIEVISSQENISLQDDGIQLPLREATNIDNVWRTRTWGGKPGWHTLETKDGNSLRYYVFDSRQWTSLNISNQRKANGLFKAAFQENMAEEVMVWKEIPPIIFYIIFVASAGFLWVAPKI